MYGKSFLVPLLLALSGCFSISTTNLMCSAEGDCPPGQSCGADNKCHPSSGGDMTVAADAPMTVGDLMPDLTPVADLTVVPDLTDPCTNHIKDGRETDVDCGGGSCGDCPSGKGCAIAADCQSRLCNMTTHICAADHCGDGVKNAGESDIDCGGTCVAPSPDAGIANQGKCGAAMGCIIDTDCQSGYCNSNSSVCAANACSDGRKDGDEADSDCGGSCSVKCTVGKHCLVNGDCASSLCAAGFCTSPGCSNTVKDGAETDVDCGGGTCATCSNGKICTAQNDCSSRHCASGLCVACLTYNDCPMHGNCVSNSCNAAACNDGITNGNESDTDCGGGCPKCGNGKGCGAAGDCTSGVCTGGTCQMPTCNDGVKNQNESDVDCGGSCGKCDTGKTCSSAADCVSGKCTAGTCRAPVCNDSVKNGDETDVDCGGGTCTSCGNGKGCANGARDCQSSVCTGGSCAIPTCNDGVKNSAETDTDCGGGSCATCGNGKHCSAGNDCMSAICSSGTCILGTCNDSTKNGAETDVDCGGGGCNGCAIGQHCSGASDCLSGVCTGSSCVAPSCNDGVKNGLESDVDCGGICSGCANGKRCVMGSDCLSSACNEGTCYSHCLDGTKNFDETDIDCGGSYCSSCSVNQACSVNNDCGTTRCFSGYCTPVSGPPNWVSAQPMYTARGYLGAALASDGYIYAYGGYRGTVTGAVEYYLQAYDIWYDGTAMPPNNDFGYAADQVGRIWALGGDNLTPPYSDARYFSPGGAWSPGTMMPYGVNYTAAATASDGRIFVIGGLDNGGAIQKRVLAFYPTNGLWDDSIAQLNHARIRHTAAAASGRIYAIGGNDGDAYKSVEVYDTYAEFPAWTVVAPLNSSRPYIPAAVSAPDGRIYVFGGDDSNTAEAYTPALNRWVNVATMNVGRTFTAGTSSPDGRIYAIGGYGGNSPLSTIEYYGPAVTLSPSSGTAGSTASVSGTNFAASALVRIYFDSGEVASATTDGNGVLAPTQFTIPIASPNGVHYILVRDDKSLYPTQRSFRVGLQ